MNVSQAQAIVQKRAQARRANRRYLIFVILVAPAVLLRLLTVVYPIAQTAYLSLTNLSLSGGTNAFVGFKNYTTLSHDFGIQTSISFTILFVVASTALQLIVGMLVALLLNANLPGRGFARAINLIPWA